PTLPLPSLAIHHTCSVIHHTPPLAPYTLSLPRRSSDLNVQVAGQPVVGRSGGGLFSADGMVIGVCNAAEPVDREGLFAALGSIQDRKSTRLNSSHRTISYAVFCLKKKKSRDNCW